MPATLLRTRPAKFAVLLVVFGWLALAACRIAGPSDLYDKEQPRTVSYTADILLHHNWVLPYDSFGIPATKPPLFNWISVPFVAVFGYQEWALKSPSLLASAAVLLCLFIAAKQMRGSSPATLAALAGLLWLANFMTAKLMYVARPDMLVAALLIGCWIAANAILTKPRRSHGAALVFWLCAAGAALTKGPIVLIPIAYLIVGAPILTRRWRPLKRGGFWWGLPLLLAAFGAWAYIAYRQEPEFFRQVLLGREVAQRMGKPYQWLLTLPNGPFYMIARFLPWSLLVLAALACIPLIPKTKRRSHPLAPAFLWVTVVAVSFCFLSTKRPDRYAPVFPAMAMIAAWFVLYALDRFHIRFGHIAGMALVFIAGVCVYNQWFDNPAELKVGDNLITFAKAVRAKTGNDVILFEDGEQTPLETLLGRAEPLDPPLQTQAAARWCIKFYEPGSTGAGAGGGAPAVVSEPIAQIDGPHAGKLALYPLPPGAGVAEWTRAELVPRVFIDEATSKLSTAPENGERWLQFWHEHSPLPKPK